MSGTLELSALLASLNPQLHPDEYVFCLINQSSMSNSGTLAPFALINEAEGLTAILTREKAAANDLPFDTPLRRITLQVHSHLEAVGLTAAVATALARRGISANVVAGFYHDHIFVPSQDAQLAMRALGELQTNAR
jgi:hypothetical protein